MATTEQAKQHTETTVTSLPACGICGQRLAQYDGKTAFGPWVFMCGPCFINYGTGLGLGKGQKLVLKKGSE
jgi:hypothetical protein